MLVLISLVSPEAQVALVALLMTLVLPVAPVALVTLLYQVALQILALLALLALLLALLALLAEEWVVHETGERIPASEELAKDLLRVVETGERGAAMRAASPRCDRINQLDTVATVTHWGTARAYTRTGVECVCV